tara:strand:- start:215 stop:796 length:582 start_codon:yes stop_codon:yes gene_type:complete
MAKIQRSELWSLEEYALIRNDFREQVIDHKKYRRISVGPNATFIFEDKLTIKYQVQEMLRTERIFEPDQINDELDAYNPLIPDGTNFKATFFIEFPDSEERKIKLGQLGGIEHKIWLRIGKGEKTYAVANEDMDRSDGKKAAAVHFLRFELNSIAITSAKSGAEIEIGIGHEALSGSAILGHKSRESLISDLI